MRKSTIEPVQLSEHKTPNPFVSVAKGNHFQSLH
jgi:hypothetical protein